MKYAVAAFLVMMSLAFAEHTPAAQPKAILVFGDSLSEGFMLKHSEAYPALLAKKLRAARLNFLVTSASASGGTTDGGLERLPPHLKRKIDILILELGINDAFRGVPVEQIQKNLQEIIEMFGFRIGSSVSIDPRKRYMLSGSLDLSKEEVEIRVVYPVKKGSDEHDVWKIIFETRSVWRNRYLITEIEPIQRDSATAQ